MSKINRRRILQTGLAAGTLAATARQAIGQEIQPQPDKPLAERLAQAPAGNVNPSSTVYDRPMSRLLIRACGLAVAQFLLSQTNQDYDGSINTLAEYDPQFNRYRQIASFRAAQLSLAQQETMPVAGLANNKTASGESDHPPATEVAIRVAEVFFGFALSSDTHHVIALRGTQTGFEWLGNVSSRQVNFRNREPQYGRVHRGFQISQEQIITQVRRTLPQLDPALPLFITGHSLGGAVAMLTAADLALDNSFPGRQTRVYTYGSPRVGDATFVTTYNQLVSQTYRVVNLADTVPITPPSSFRGDLFQHTGQEWSYLSQLGETAINHAIETYQIAIDRAVEVNQTRNYPMSAGNCV